MISLKWLLLIPLYFFVKHQKVFTINYQSGKNKQEAADEAENVAKKMAEKVKVISLKLANANEKVIERNNEKAKAVGSDEIKTARSNESRAKTARNALEVELANAEMSSQLANANAKDAKLATHRIGSFHVDFSEILHIHNMFFAIPVVGEILDKLREISKSVINWLIDQWNDTDEFIRIILMIIGFIITVGLSIGIYNTII